MIWDRFLIGFMFCFIRLRTFCVLSFCILLLLYCIILRSVYYMLLLLITMIRAA